MNPQTLSQRLERVAAHVPVGARLADIGSDHAYLPVALLRRGMITAAVAGELALTPFHAARRTVRENGLEQHITVRQANGLAALEPEDAISVISLCGMGGETIRDILDSGQSRLRGHECLVLQPNGGEPPLRRWLMEQGYGITAEEVLRENRFDYEIIVARPMGPVAYSEQQLYFGPHLLQARSPAFVLKWQTRLRQKHKVMGTLQKAQVMPEAQLQVLRREIQWISAVLE